MLQSGPTQKPSRAEEINHTGVLLLNKGEFEPARLHFLGALMLEPANVNALQNLGACLRALGHNAAAEIISRRSVAASQGENPFCISNLGVAQFTLKKYDEAIKSLNRALEMLPQSAPQYHNLGLVYYILGNYERALGLFEESLELQYADQAASDRALTLLSLGRIQEGLEAYEVRWNILKKMPIWEMGIAEWQGEALDGCRLLVHHEQGFGDSLMLVRFIKALAKYQCSITLAVPAPLVRLFQRSFPFCRVLDMNGPLPEADAFDYHTPMLSLMRWAGVKQPKEISAESYLVAKPEPVIRLPDNRRKIGICWASGNHTKELNDRRRLAPLTLFLPLLEDPSVSVVSLQAGTDSKDLIANGLEGIIFDPMMKVENFAHTADIIACLDLVISVDSAVAHLAGAIGKPVLMLSPYSRCWRWWGKETGWPWYGRMRTYQQEQGGAWDKPVAKAIRDALWIMK